MIAVRKGPKYWDGGPSLEIIKMLIEAGADVNATDSANETALKKALYITCPDTDVVKMLLEAGADVNIQNNDGITPLMYAAQCCNPNIVHLMINAGADVNISCKGMKTVDFARANPRLKKTQVLEQLENMTAPRGPEWGKSDEEFLAVCEIGHLADIMAAIQNGADVNVKNIMGETLLMKIVECEIPIEIVKYLIDAGADVNMGAETLGGAVLMRAVSPHNINFERSKEPDPDIVKLLIDAGADVNATDVLGETVLMHASRYGNPELIKILLDSGITNLNSQDNTGLTALMMACQSNSAEAIKALLDAGASIELKDQNGNCAVDFILMGRYPHDINDTNLIERLSPKANH